MTRGAPSGSLAVPRAAVAAPRVAVAAAAAGCAALTARPLLLGVGGAGPAPMLTVLFLSLLAVSVLWPPAAAPSRRRAPRPSTVPPAGRAAVLAVGVGAFLVGRVLVAGSPAAQPATAFLVGLNTLAAVAEEAFFRRLVYGALLSGGPGLAVGGSAVLFAAVHVTVYGLWVLPLDLAAGLVLGWQRQATGSWAVPAVTHVV
ncbi:MAG TPA: CPBP family intramembrane glutamic endopeptidase, partial [Acidimicrobiia bacterium]|nr:CPBP family intramembrane glutamic endopeptidase [Acidimicrobiia bacterium]